MFLPLLILMFLAGCSNQIKYNLPQALLYKGKPIHPSCIGATQLGDSSQLDPKSVEYVEDSYFTLQTKDFICKKLSEDILYDAHTNAVTSTLSYCTTCIYGQETHTSENKIVDSYQYIGSYKGKHIVCGTLCDSGARGRFGFLGLIEREGDFIKNSGDIAFGDRGFGGVIQVIFHHNNIVRYRQCASLNIVALECTGEEIDIFIPPYSSCGVSLVHEVNLDYFVGDYPYFQMHTTVGLTFDLPEYTIYDAYEPRENDLSEQFHYCFNTIANMYVQQGRKELTMSEAQQFWAEVIQCMFKTDSNWLTK